MFALSNFKFQQIPGQAKPNKTDTTKNTKVLKKSSLDSKLEYYAKDSINTDMEKEISYLYGGARVVYEGFELDADFIRFDSKNKIIFASGVKSEKGKYVGRPIFKMGEEGAAIADSLIYNTQTKEGIVYSVYKEQEGGYFSGGKTKMQPDHEFHVAGTTYSTCNLPEPHYGIHITKGIATENHILTGPVYMEFEGIPMPLGLPFAFFPKPNKKASGFILPTPGEDATRGFSLTNGGYYFAFNDYMDARIMGNIFTNGSYDLNLTSNYTKRYKYNGNLNFAYSSTRNGLEGTPQYKPQKNFNVTWSHSQNPNARPGTTFSASVNAGTSSYYSVTAANGTYDANAMLRNTMSSSISYGKVFGDGLFNFTSALRHSQETQSKTISLTLPDVNLNMATISPFDSKKSVGEKKWYQKLTVGYGFQASNTVSTKEDLLFTQDGLKRFKNGFQHTIPISLPFNLFQYLNFNSSVNYTERWYMQTIEKKYIRNVPSDIVVTDTLDGFKRAGEYNLSMGMTTKLYGRKDFKNLGGIKAIRHVMTPSISFTYKPDFASIKNTVYRDQQYYINDLRPGKLVPTNEYVRDANGNILKYSTFEQGIYGGPSQGKQASIGFSLDNNVELKVRSSKDTTGNGERKIQILQGLSLSSSYNFVQPQKKLAPINFGGRSQFTDKLGINFGGTFSPYLVEQVAYTTGTGANQVTTYSYQEVDKYTWTEGKFPRLVSLNLSFDYSLNPEAIKSHQKNVDNLRNDVSNNRTAEQAEQLAAISRDPNAFVDFNIPWNINFSYNFNYNNPLSMAASRSITNTVNFSGDFNLTSKWKVQFRSGYDFKANNLSQTSFAIYRDLHCWDLSANWVPFGIYQSYSIDIRVKASILQDLKLSKRKGYYTTY
ncbi:putative LPS assembly protein LptD [Pedobacter montanisoli]|uniref:LPS-assembly protein LptD n=1 Tax=Pedobacter montanisoli TaxID=2923277 RepID=A0ABS9ZYJ3_9SPHI|nr:putative LPS assembly protein LptD [Pedobacter montanisoli]MCJ0743373.1 LPS-assembly protein LptD [Pedobacter montanisoli]